MGKCNHCSGKISLGYPIVEIISAIALLNIRTIGIIEISLEIIFLASLYVGVQTSIFFINFIIKLIYMFLKKN